MKVAVLVKQVPRAESLELGEDGRLVREGVELDMNAYCRRAVAKGVEIASRGGGSCTVFTLGPPSAEDVLREAIAWGAARGLNGAIRAVHLCDVEFAGSDTLATARALASALSLKGPFDLVLVGRNSVDADTGQVGPEVAELLGLPFVPAVRELDLEGDVALRARCELDDGWREVRVALPAMVSTAERLCDPAKVDPEERQAVGGGLIERLSARELGEGPWGAAGSLTSVGETRLMEVSRKRVLLSGDPAEQARRAVDLLEGFGVLSRIAEGDAGKADGAGEGSGFGRGASDGASDSGQGGGSQGGAQGGAQSVARSDSGALDGESVIGSGRDVRLVAVLEEPGRPAVTAGILAEAARIARIVGGPLVRLVLEPAGGGPLIEEEVAREVARWCSREVPWALLTSATLFGREVAARVAARIGAGLTGDAVELDVSDGRLVCWKPAFGGRMVAAVTASSPVQMATLRPAGSFEGREGSISDLAPVTVALEVRESRRLEVLDEARDDDVARLLGARVVVAVGQGVDPSHYGEVEDFAKLLGAELAATRKVTDKGWMPRSRQVGLTGHGLSPELYILLGASGKFNHVVGTRSAGTLLAVNTDRDAPVFEWADVGLVADWREVLPHLAEALGAKLGALAN